MQRWLQQEGTVGFLIFLAACCVVWSIFLSLFWGSHFVPHFAPDDDTMHKTVIYFMLGGEDFYSAWRHAAIICGDLSDLRIYRTPIIFYTVVILTGWAGDAFVFPLSVLCVVVAASNLILSFWTTRRMLGSGWAGMAASFAQYAYFFNVIPRFQISLFAMPFLIMAVYWAWQNRPWLASGSFAISFLIKESFGFALPAILALYLIRRQIRYFFITVGISAAAIVLYLLHLFIAQPTFYPPMLFAATPSMILINLVGFLWFGFIALYYNVILPVTIGGNYPFSPIPPFLPYPLFLTLLILQVVFVWGPIIWWTYYLIRYHHNLELGIFGYILWLVPLAITATAPATLFSLLWIDFAVWRWFAPGYVGFQLLVAISWHQLRQRMKKPRKLGGIASI
ncbi:MAG: hypothetical protein ACFFDP_03985 [Promethearchaeota archaeon]